jgi:Flp pilus assembly protein TadB
MNDRRGGLRPTEPATLVVAALGAAAVAWLLIGRFYGGLPRLTWSPVLVIAAIAVVEVVVAQNTYARVHRRGTVAAPPRTPLGRLLGTSSEPVEPLAVARYAVLAKASSLAGAILAGLYGGVLVWLLVEARRLTAAAEDLPAAFGGVVASLGLVAAALALERACRVPEPPDETGDRTDQPAEPDGDPGT